MPRNLRGGKAFKKGKKADHDEDEIEKIVYIDRQPDQMVGRLTRLLGDLNTQVYCQDNKLRVCKICRSIKKKVRFKVGDVVLISLRDCEVSQADLDKGIRSDRGDVLAKYHPEQYAQLKSEGIPHTLFAQMETVDGIVTDLGAGKAVDVSKIKKEEDLFANDSDSESEGELEDADIDKI